MRGISGTCFPAIASACLTLSACTVNHHASRGREHGHEHATTELCQVLEVPLQDLRHRSGSFADMVAHPASDRSQGYAGAAIAFALGSGPIDVDPYRPTLGFIQRVADIRYSDASAPVRQDRRSHLRAPAAVRRNAQALDQAVQHGLCR